MEDQGLYASGHSCLDAEDRITSFAEMTPEMKMAGAIEVSHYKGLQRLRQRGLLTYSQDGLDVSEPTARFTLTGTGWIVFERVRHVSVSVMVELTADRERCMGRRRVARAQV